LQELQRLEVQLGHWDEELKDNDWIERILNNKDWEKLVKLYKNSMVNEENDLKFLENKLLTTPMTINDTIKLKETVMLMKRDMENRDAFTSFPGREVERLKQVRKEYEIAKLKIEELKRGGYDA
jgi:hypothetical protein